MDERFEAIIAKTLRHEGGYVNDPQDPGGRTKYGISQRAYPNVDIKNLTKEEAVEIYYQDYWIAPGIFKIEYTPLAAKVFDLGVNSGPKRAIKLLQEVLNTFAFNLKTDGQLGPETLKAISGVEKPEGILALYLQRYERFYRSLNKPRFIKGWLKRLYS